MGVLGLILPGLHVIAAPDVIDVPASSRKQPKTLMEPPTRAEWKTIAWQWLAGPNLPYLCLLIICVLSLISRIVLLWR